MLLGEAEMLFPSRIILARGKHSSLLKKWHSSACTTKLEPSQSTLSAQKKVDTHTCARTRTHKDVMWQCTVEFLMGDVDVSIRIYCVAVVLIQPSFLLSFHIPLTNND